MYFTNIIKLQYFYTNKKLFIKLQQIKNNNNFRK